MALVPNPVTGQLDVAEQVTVEGIAGTGTTGTIAKFTDTAQVGDSSITDDGSTVEVDADLDVLGDILVNGVPISTGAGPGGETASLQANDGAGGFFGLDLKVDQSGEQTLVADVATTLLTIPLEDDTNYAVLVIAVGRCTVAGNATSVGDLAVEIRVAQAKRVAGTATLVAVQNVISFGETDQINLDDDTDVSGSDLLIKGNLNDNDGAPEYVVRAHAFILAA